MATHDYVIDNQTAAQFRGDLNNALSAIVSQNSNATEPSTKFANMIWYDTANNLVKMRNEDNDAWINLYYLDQSTDAIHLLDDTSVVNTSGVEQGILGDQADGTWTAGTGTLESLVSPAKIKAAAEAFCLGSFNATNQLFNHPSGLQLRFGTFSSTSDSSEAFTFTTAFSTACLVVVTSVGGSVPVKSTTGFSFNRLDSYSGTHVSDYIALGH